GHDIGRTAGKRRRLGHAAARIEDERLFLAGERAAAADDRHPDGVAGGANRKRLRIDSFIDGERAASDSIGGVRRDGQAVCPAVKAVVVCGNVYTAADRRDESQRAVLVEVDYVA